MIYLRGLCNWSARRHCSSGREIIIVMSSLLWSMLWLWTRSLSNHASFPTCPFLWSRSFISVSRASSSFGGTALPIYQGHFEFSSLSFKVLTTLPKSVPHSIIPPLDRCQITVTLGTTLPVRSQCIQPVINCYLPAKVLESAGLPPHTQSRKGHRDTKLL